jgi:16S rRNA (uracil1498-N3)-methyltransferase
MPANRFFIEKLFPAPILIQKEELYHLHVMRTRPRETIELVNGRGEIATALVEHIDKKKARLQILEHKKIPPPTQNLILAQGLPKFSSLEWIVEKGTEIGATEFWLFPGALSEKKTISPTQLHRLNALTISGLKQCGRLYLPKITIHPEIEKWGKISGSIFFGSLRRSPRIEGPFSNPTVFFIGPEKGFSPKELVILEKMGAKGISLCENILRSETAAIAALSQFSLLFKAV